VQIASRSAGWIEPKAQSTAFDIRFDHVWIALSLICSMRLDENRPIAGRASDSEPSRVDGTKRSLRRRPTYQRRGMQSVPKRLLERPRTWRTAKTLRPRANGCHIQRDARPLVGRAALTAFWVAYRWRELLSSSPLCPSSPGTRKHAQLSQHLRGTTESNSFRLRILDSEGDRAHPMIS